jgi:hypothetical protein
VKFTVRHRVAASRLALAVVVTVALALTPVSASAAGYNTVPCWQGTASTYGAVLKHKPRKCAFGGRYGYQQLNVVKLRWRSWRGATAYGRGVVRENMGYRAKVRVKLYARRRWEENTFRFTRARFNINGQGWGQPLPLRIN